jgi:hypothetical protein
MSIQDLPSTTLRKRRRELVRRLPPIEQVLRGSLFETYKRCGSQRHRLTWERMFRIVERFLPTVRVLHPWPEERLLGSVRGVASNGHPYRDILFLFQCQSAGSVLCRSQKVRDVQRFVAGQLLTLCLKILQEKLAFFCIIVQGVFAAMRQILIRPVGINLVYRKP